ncbi:DUF4263 domain-containing protein [Brevundimonas naejangsanensis]|uniref:DUF4263 domain-containing protein n=1 Tax=Brevundimonas naejangsanensis TaxID=588932 RepID=A0A494RKD5_9CAUL|nr:Shedu immune nuclease family protein [Brevundimonas naejangsanensis]AYG94334.1 DUF4263 domain-containing protein [Brevundimonas naejangsanensis]
MDDSERDFHFNKQPNTTYFSKRIVSPFREPVRILSSVVETAGALRFAKVKDEILLRATPGGRVEIKAAVLEDDRSIETLTIQKFTPASGPSDKVHFTFLGREIDALLEFMAGVKTIDFGGDGKGKLSREAVRTVVLTAAQAHQIFSTNQDLFIELAEREDLQRDLIAVGYRRGQLDRFEKMLADRTAFAAEQARYDKTPEATWQAFFEENTWIFGYGLTYQFLSGLDEKRLEQTVRGADISGPGKRIDALMKTRGIISSLCFVEVKRHDTDLLDCSKPYRSGAWAVSKELSGGVAQVQTTVADTLDRLSRAITVSDADGDPTGELLFNVQPKSFLVIGQLSEFQSDRGINQPKFRSFEMFRREMRSPEIITFDELLNRARFIVDHPITR